MSTVRVGGLGAREPCKIRSQGEEGVVRRRWVRHVGISRDDGHRLRKRGR